MVQSTNIAKLPYYTRKHTRFLLSFYLRAAAMSADNRYRKQMSHRA